jgi:dephospho-CoA kinase
MFVLGLTGSIGMGKSTTAAMFREIGIPVHDSDKTVHELYSGELAPVIEAAFPGSVHGGKVDRTLLGKMVLGNPSELRRLEVIVHPLVRREEHAFLAQASFKRFQLVVLDIPLLLETKGENRVDGVLVVTAPYHVQRARVLARNGMTEQRFIDILQRQVPDAEKQKKAHFIVDTDKGINHARKQVFGIVRALSGVTGRNRVVYA